MSVAMLKVYPLSGEEGDGYALVLILDGMFATMSVEKAAAISAGAEALARVLATELLLPMVTLERERLQRGQTREQAAAAAISRRNLEADA